MKKYISHFLITLFLLCSYSFVSAQQRQITGSVMSTTGEGIPSATVMVKETNEATTTNEKGRFSIRATTGQNLEISSIGYLSQSFPIGKGNNIRAVLQTSGKELGEVVVTALGIKREKRSLGYSVQQVEGNELTKTNQPNVLSSLSGKVSGMQITTASGAIGASSRIVLRGNNSFGNNQPLFVVDGVPIDNSYTSLATYGSTDYGSAIQDIDPDNIASITVLKGANAAALYGSRGGNGVILITTKTGKNSNKGIGLSYSGGISFDRAYILPKLQNQYGQGAYGSEYYFNLYKAGNLDLSSIGVDPTLNPQTYQEWAQEVGFSYVDGNGSGINDGVDESWGPRLDIGLKLPQYNSPLDANGNRIATPWVSPPHNALQDFFQTGYNVENNVAMTSNSDKGSTRFSLGHQKQTGTVPNTDQTRYNIQLNTEQNLTKKLKVGTIISYIRLENKNIIGQGYSPEYSPMVQLTNWMGRQVNVEDLKEHYNEVFPDGFPYNWNGNFHDNPFFIVYKNLHSRLKNRLFGNFHASYEFSKWFNAFLRVGDDFSNESRKEISDNKSVNSVISLNPGAWGGGKFTLNNIYLNELNTDFILTGSGNITKDFSLNYTAGANYRNLKQENTTLGANRLTVPNLFTIGNANGSPITGMYNSELRSNSVYGEASLGYKNWLYVDVTGRNDWSSTLPANNWSYFYPSASLSWIFTDALNIHSSIFNYGKFRLSRAKVGNATDPYQLLANYGASSSGFNGVTLYSLSSTLPPLNLKPESATSNEFGTDLQFFNNRIGMSATYYDKVTTNQILSVNISTATGANALKLNAGEIENKGIELQLNFNILKPSDENGFNWNLSLNWAKNSNKVNKLYEDPVTHQKLQSYNLGNTFITVNAIPGQAFGTLMGSAFLKSDKTPGSYVVDANGLPEFTTGAPSVLGNITPDWVGGINNSFSYKNISLSFLIDARMGGDIWSETINGGVYAGSLARTTDNNVRVTGIVPGVDRLTNMKFVKEDGTPDDMLVAARAFYERMGQIAQYDIIKGSYVKLREISLNYAFTSKFLKKMEWLKVAGISLFAYNVALLYKDKSNWVNVDPETSLGIGNNGVGIENQQIPSNRSIGLKLNLNF